MTMTAVEIAVALRRLNVPPEKADAAAARYSTESHDPRLNQCVVAELAKCATPCTGEMRDGGLSLTLLFPPRTKKNHGRGVAKQSTPFVRFRWLVLDGLAPIVARLGLPLPDGEFNLAAVYFVDRPGERADLVGLHQALCDVLENAGVVRNDWQFRTLDGSRVVVGDPAPRVELTITPIESEAAR